MDRITASDIDGTTPGVCVMTIVRTDPDADQVLVSVDRYTEPDHPNPRLMAERLWASIRDDWPGCSVNFATNPRGHYLMTKWRMEGMGMDWSVEQHLENT
jgi:hypothetical protein